MTFKKFEPDDIVIGKPNQVSSGLFNGISAVSQSSFYTSSFQANRLTGSNKWDIKNGQYYVNVYHKNELYFSVAYGSYVNSGSSRYSSDYYPSNQRVLNNETKTIYSMYKNVLLPDGQKKFLFADYYGNNTYVSEKTTNDIIVIHFANDKVKDQIDPGQFQISFKKTNPALSGPVLDGLYFSRTFIDDSVIVNKKQKFYNLISGSIVNGVPKPHLDVYGNPYYLWFREYGGFGMVYPEYGVLILNASAIASSVGLRIPNSVNQFQSNSTPYPYEGATGFPTWYKGDWKGYIHADVIPSITKSNKPMFVRKSEYVPCKYFYVRVKNKEFNYTTNPTLLSNGNDELTEGTIIHQDFIDRPRTYITTVGLYDDNNELVAIAKLSKPVIKSFDNEVLMKVRLDF